MAAKPKLSFIQSELFWVAIICIAFKIWLTSKDAADTFGTWTQTMKQINGAVMWITALLSGKRFVDFLLSIRKMPENIGEIKDGVE